MSHHVMGALFMNHARTLKLRDDVDWPHALHVSDQRFATQHVSARNWVPMETFERIALAFLSVEGAKPEWFRALGSDAVDRLIEANPRLLVPSDPRETVSRFLVVRQSFFDFSIFDVCELTETQAVLDVHYGLGTRAEHAAAVSTAGFLTRPLELTGATRIKARLTDRTLALQWQPWPLH